MGMHDNNQGNHRYIIFSSTQAEQTLLAVPISVVCSVKRAGINEYPPSDGAGNE